MAAKAQCGFKRGLRRSGLEVTGEPMNSIGISSAHKFRFTVIEGRRALSMQQ